MKPQMLDTAAPVGDLDHRILLAQEVADRLLKRMVDLGERLRTLDENSDEYQQVIEKIGAIGEDVIELRMLVNRAMAVRADTDAPEE